MTAPRLSGFTTNFAYTENAGPVFIDSSVTLADTEGNWNGGRIVVSGLGASDFIAVASEGTGAGQFIVADDILFYMNDVGGGIVIPTPAAIITTTSTSVTIAFGSGGTTALVERVLEHLTYTNTSDDPDATARLTVKVFDAANEVAVGTDFTERPDALDPLNGVNLGNSPYTTLVDWDGDGDQDIVVGAYSVSAWRLSYLRNNGDGTLTRLTGADNPFNSIAGFTPTPAFGDIDGDGDTDMVVGQSDGTFQTWFRGPGGSLTQAIGASNPFSGFDVGNFAAAALGDVDGDNDIDLVSGATSGTFTTFQNNGGLSFTQLAGAANPFNGFDIGSFSQVALGDVDGDGDVDLVAGESGGAITYFRKDAGGYVEVVGAGNPFDGMSVANYSFPGLGDLDGDGDVDLIVGSEFNGFTWFEHNGGAVTVAITAVEDLPAAQDDQFYTDELTSETGNLLADNGNGADVDPDGPSFAITAVNGSGGNVGTQITLASGALLTVNANGTFSYDPNGAFQYVPGPASGASNSVVTDSFTYTLTGGDTATVTINVAGIDNDDVAEGTSGNDIIDGGTGTNTMSYANASTGVFANIGIAGPNDTVGAGIDTLSNFVNLTGSDFVDELRGSAGANILDGGSGADAMLGGDGDDTYYADQSGDRVLEAADQGYDTVLSLTSYLLPDVFEIEELRLVGVGELTGSGNRYDNVIIGNAGYNALGGYGGNDRLDGGGGPDLMKGGLGDDTYVVSDATDWIWEWDGQGIDTVETSIDFTLPGCEIENVTVTGSGAVNITGNAVENALTGNGAANWINGAGGNDRIDGGGGADVMAGGLGDDTFIVDNSGDRIKESAGQGNDIVETALGFSLQGLEVENLRLTGSDAVNGTGNGLANILAGNGAANSLLGYDGADTLIGAGGDDALHGMAGSDVMEGGGGADRFYFDATLGAGNVDTINDFEVGVDSIWLRRAKFDGMALGALSADAFAIGSAAGDASDRIVYDATTGALYFDPDGTGAAAAVQFATLDAGLSLTNADFTLF